MLGVLEVCFILLVAVFFVTQIFVPLFTGRPLFPSFTKSSRREQKLISQLEEIEREREEIKLERDLMTKKNELLEARLASLGLTPVSSDGNSGDHHTQKHDKEKV